MQIESCETWNRLLLECNLGQFSFILHAASDILSIYKLQHYHIQCSAKYALCGGVQPTSATYWVAVLYCIDLKPFYTYCLNQVLIWLATN